MYLEKWNYKGAGFHPSQPLATQKVSRKLHIHFSYTYSHTFSEDSQEEKQNKMVIYIRSVGGVGREESLFTEFPPLLAPCSCSSQLLAQQELRNIVSRESWCLLGNVQCVYLCVV